MVRKFEHTACDCGDDNWGSHCRCGERLGHPEEPRPGDEGSLLAPRMMEGPALADSHTTRLADELDSTRRRLALAEKGNQGLYARDLEMRRTIRKLRKKLRKERLRSMRLEGVLEVARVRAAYDPAIQRLLADCGLEEVAR